MQYSFVQTSASLLRSWILTAVAVACVVALVAVAIADSMRWVEYLASGLGVSLIVSVAAEIAAHATRKPLTQLLMGTAIRSGIPLGIILAISIRDQGLLGTEFLLYCVPTQLVTLIAGTHADLARVQSTSLAVADVNGKGLTQHGS